MSSQMDPHYFLSKSDILGWINETLNLRLTKVEETANGAVACQMLDALHPGFVPMKKVVSMAWAKFSPPCMGTNLHAYPLHAAGFQCEKRI